MNASSIRPVIASLILLGGAALAAGCSGAEPADVEGEPVGTSSEAATEGGRLGQGACTGKRWVAKLSAPGVQCPAAPPLWQVEDVLKAFPASQYCLYTTQGAGTSTFTPPAPLPPTTWVGSPAQDCNIVGALATPDDQLLASMASSLRTQIDGAPAVKGATPIDVALIDTVPTSFDAGALMASRSSHGATLFRIIENVTCPRSAKGEPLGACAPTPWTVLGLPMRSQSALPKKPSYIQDDDYGGYLGTPAQVARAISDAVNHYALDLALDAKAAPRLVVNLSLGWEAEQTSGPPEKFHATGSVLHALRIAACHGALSIAAAGNAGGRVAKGAMYPAAWESVPAPKDLAACQALGLPVGYEAKLPKRIFSDKVAAPVINAIDAVDGADDRIVIARPGANTRLVAPGDHASTIVRAGARTVDKPTGAVTTSAAAQPTPPLTGTSVAAALTSATAALVWGYRPDLPPQELFEAMRRGGVKLEDRMPSVCGEAMCNDPTYRLDVCGAIHAACEGAADASWACSTTLPTCAPVPFRGGMPTMGDDALLDAIAARATSRGDVSGLTGSLDAACGSDAWVWYAGTTPPNPKQACPDQTLLSSTAVPWAGPQPNLPTCPSCNVRQTFGVDVMNVFVQVADYTSNLYGATLVLTNGTTTEYVPLAYALDPYSGTVVPGRAYNATIYGRHLSGRGVRASIAFRVATPLWSEQVTTSVPLLVSQTFATTLH